MANEKSTNGKIDLYKSVSTAKKSPGDTSLGTEYQIEILNSIPAEKSIIISGGVK